MDVLIRKSLQNSNDHLVMKVFISFPNYEPNQVHAFEN